MMTRLIIVAFILAFAGPSAFAAEALRGDIFCFPAKDVSKIVNNLGKVDKARRDVVDVDINPKFLIKDGGVWPERFYFRTAEQDIDITVEKPSGLTPTFLENAFAYPESDICVADKTRADKPADDEGLYFEMGLSPYFHNTTGRHEIAELKEGTKDGKAFYRKMIPAAVRMFMPDTDYLAVKYDDLRTTGAKVFAHINGQDVPLMPELFKEMHVISFKDLEAMGASALIIKGGDYHLQPIVSIKTMKRFGWGSEEEEE